MSERYIVLRPNDEGDIEESPLGALYECSRCYALTLRPPRIPVSAGVAFRFSASSTELPLALALQRREGQRKVNDEQAVISHRIVTYFKRPKGQTGVTQLGSKRMDSLTALDWILSRYPDEAWDIDDSESRSLVIRLHRTWFDLASATTTTRGANDDE